jgi:hypothetical protein
MNIYQYTAKHNPQGVVNIINKYGYKASDKWEMNAELLKKVVLKHGDQVLKDIAVNHPDAKLIIQNYKAPNIIQSETVKFNNCDACNDEAFNNCSGCGGTCGKNKDKNMNADGDTNQNTANAFMDYKNNTLNPPTPLSTPTQAPTPEVTPITPTVSSSYFKINKELVLILSAIVLVGIVIHKN